MTPKQILSLNCPRCNSILDVEIPDKLRPCASINKLPDKKSGIVIEKSYECKNASCQAKITVYWYDEFLFIDRV